MIIRRMELRDVDDVYAVECESFHTPWSRQSFVDDLEKNPCARYMIAEVDGHAVGYAGTWMVLEEGHITNIAVAEAYRRQGIGEAVTRALMQYASNLGVEYMTLEVRRSNMGARHMYEKLGFIQLGVRKHYYEDNNEDALLMVCTSMPEADPDFTEAETKAE